MSLIEGEDYYVNEEGKVVLTAKYHLQRGYCCSNGCRHCPYGYENVSEPKKTQLLNERKKREQQSGKIENDTPLG
ncbi:DUF5522 domain-containing protein [Niabella hirudinis]|uniref:DUF5522 domain-containing protein n=1 Tax=Niabella hirudinis TaxID=1285929 RepID=UPI003EBE2C88